MGRYLPRPLCNVPIFDRDERLIAIVDLLDVEAGCVGEYQGADHKEGERHRRDVAREQKLRDHRLECFEVVGGDVQDRDLTVKRMLAARERSLFEPPSRRTWTLRRPHGGPSGPLNADCDTSLWTPEIVRCIRPVDPGLMTGHLQRTIRRRVWRTPAG